MSESIVGAQETLSATSGDVVIGPGDRRRYLRRLRQLEREQDTLGLHTLWEEAANHFMPGSYRRTFYDRTHTPVPDPDIVNGCGMLARRVMGSGIATSLTSPARDWAALGTPDTDLMKWRPAKIWYAQLAQWMFGVFARSNVYQVLPRIYETVGTHGVSCATVEDDPVDLIRLYPMTMGTFFLANSPRLEIDTVYRKLQMTVGNVVRAFGLERTSQRTRTQYQRGQVDDWVDLVRVIEPNEQQQFGKLDASGMPLRSLWFELADGLRTGFLRESGYWETPILAPRWETEGEDVYGRSNPGFSSLPDSRMLQQYGRREGQLVDYITAPPVEGTSQMEGSYPLPGEVIPTAYSGPQNQVRALRETSPNAVTVVDARQQRLETRVNEWWYVHLWMAILMDERNQRATAREIAEQHEEKLVQLGPTLVRFFNELLDKLIEKTVQVGIRKSIPFWLRGEPGLFPPPPRELMGQPLRVEYISPLALAMKLVGISAVERLASFAGNIGAAYPPVWDKVNWDRMIEVYGDRLSVDPDLIVPQDVVDKKRANQAAAAAQQQMMEKTLPAVAKSAAVLGNTEMNTDSALTRLLAARGLAPMPGGR